MRKVMIAVAAMAVLLVLTALIGPRLIDWNAYKAEISEAAMRATGRALQIEGDLTLSLLPSPRLAADGVRLANIDGASSPDMARIARLAVRLRLIPLLSGRIEIAGLTLDRPEIALERLADGRENWRFTPPDSPEKSTDQTPSDPTNPSDSGGTPPIRLDIVEIRQGTLTYKDQKSGVIEEANKISAEIRADSLTGPFRIDGAFERQGVGYGLALNVGALDAASGTPVEAEISLPTAGAKARLVGTFDRPLEAKGPPRGAGRLELSGPNLAAALTAASVAPPPGLAHRFALSAELAGDAEHVTLDALSLALGAASLRGEAAFRWAQGRSVRLTLRGGEIDIAPFLAARVAQPPPRQAAPAPGDAPSAPNETAPNTAATHFALPKDFDANIDLAIAALRRGDAAFREIRLAGTLKKGEVRGATFSARLPGGGSLSLDGGLSSAGGKLRYQGQGGVDSNDLRAVASLFGADLDQVPADRLRRARLAVKFNGDETTFTLAEARGQIDASRFEAAAQVNLSARPALGARVDIDHFNLDAYLPPTGAAGTVADSQPKPQPNPQPRRQPGPGSKAGGAGPLAVLERFDANIQGRIGSLHAFGQGVQGVTFDGTLRGGTATINSLQIRDIGGLALSAVGAINGFASQLGAQINARARIGDVGATVRRLAGIESPLAARIGGADLAIEAKHGASETSFDLTAGLAGGAARINGVLAGAEASAQDRTAPPYRLGVEIDHPELSGLIAAFGGGAPGKLGRVRLSAKASGSLAALAIEAGLKLPDGTAALRGSLAQALVAPRFDFALTANHGELGPLLRGLGGAPSGPLGTFELSANLTGDTAQVRIGAVRAKIGTTPLTGEVLAKFAAKPHIAARFDAGDIVLDPWFGGAQAKRVPASRAEGRKTQGGNTRGGEVKTAGGPGKRSAAAVPTESVQPAGPLDVSWLDALEGEIEFTAKSIAFEKWRMDRPRLSATLDDAMLALREFTGELFDGSFAMTGRLAGREVPNFETQLSVKDSNVATALLQSGIVDVSAGRTDFRADLAGQGATKAALVASLKGGGALSVADGKIRGFDLAAVSKRLTRVERSVDLLGLLGAAMSGGETPVAKLEGEFRVDQGVVRSDAVRVDAPSGTGTIAFAADLPRWALDLTANFKLAEPADAPPFAVRLTGPLDAPDRKLEFQALQAYLARRGLGAVLRDALDKDKPKPAEGEAPAKRPADLLRDFLGGQKNN